MGLSTRKLRLPHLGAANPSTPGCCCTSALCETVVALPSAQHPGTISPRHPGTTSPQHSSTTDPRHPGTTGPQHHQSLSPWHHRSPAPPVPNTPAPSVPTTPAPLVPINPAPPVPVTPAPLVPVTPAPPVPTAPGAAAPRGPGFTIRRGQSESLSLFLTLLQLILKLSSPPPRQRGAAWLPVPAGIAVQPLPRAHPRTHPRMLASQPSPGGSKPQLCLFAATMTGLFPQKGSGRAAGGTCPIATEPGQNQPQLHGSEVSSATGSPPQAGGIAVPPHHDPLGWIAQVPSRVPAAALARGSVYVSPCRPASVFMCVFP